MLPEEQLKKKWKPLLAHGQHRSAQLVSIAKLLMQGSAA